MGQRERLVELRRKRNSIATDHIPFTSLPFVDSDTGHYSDGDSIASREVYAFTTDEIWVIDLPHFLLITQYIM